MNNLHPQPIFKVNWGSSQLWTRLLIGLWIDFQTDCRANQSDPGCYKLLYNAGICLCTALLLYG